MAGNFRIEEINAEDLSATDLHSEWAAANASTGPACAYRVWFGDHAEPGFALYFPDMGRAGVAHGADAQWTDCDSVEDAIDRFISGDLLS